MFLFIPAWYEDSSSWQEKEVAWYWAEEFFAFDDTIHQIRMFQEQKEDLIVTVLSYTPNLRHFLHRQGLDTVKRWSVFDEIQNVSGNQMKVVRPEHLQWPENIEWMWNPFFSLGLIDGERYCRVEYSEDGNPFLIKRYEEGELRNLIRIDDRGFLSSCTLFEQGRAVSCEYYDEYGDWQIRHDMLLDEVEVNPLFSTGFLKIKYQSMQELILEKVKMYLAKQDQKFVVVVAASDQNMNLMEQLPMEQKKIVSFFSRRYRENKGILPEHMEQINLVVADTQLLAEELKKKMKSHRDKVIVLSPYDTRMTLGKSQRIGIQKIYIPISNLSAEKLQMILEAIRRVMDRGIRLEVHLDLGNAGAAEKQRLTQELERMNPKDRGIPDTSLMIRTSVSENQIIKLLGDVRLIVDLRDSPDLYIQIAGMSAGIPQINCTRTGYVTHLENGMILERDSELEQALLFYLEELENWNQSLVCSVRKIKEYSGEKIVEQWKRVTETDGK